MAHAGGRPMKYETAKQLERLFDAYIEECKRDERPLTITGLANAIEMSRESLIEYSHKDEFVDTIKKYKSIVLQSLEERLVAGKSNPTGVIFNLKNNYGWEDKRVVESNNTNVTLSIEDIEARKRELLGILQQDVITIADKQ